MSELPAHVAIDRDAWTATNAAYTDEVARHRWAETQITEWNRALDDQAA